MRENASTRVTFDRAVVAALTHSLAARVPSQRRPVPSPRRPWLVGICGLQGSGKTTLTKQLARTLSAAGIATQCLSLDDFYFGRRARQRLARDVHPLLATRGVPGTHDIALLERVLRQLQRASPKAAARVPRFDKGRDTRLPPSRWRRVAARADCILLEGWCVGVPAQPSSALAESVNALERNEDADGRWRHWVNTQLRRDYAALWKKLDALIVLQAPSFDVVVGWRDEQERALRKRAAAQAMDAAAIRRFVQFYERISCHALRVLPARADWRLDLDADRRVTRVVASGVVAGLPRQA